MVCERFPWQPLEIPVAIHVNTAGMLAAVDLICRDSTLTDCILPAASGLQKKPPVLKNLA